MSIENSFWIQPESCQLISQGAEAILYKGYLHDRPCVYKQRFKKLYRHPTLDEKINIKRVKDESKMINRLRQNGIDVPSVYFVDTINYTIIMEFIDGVTMKSFLDDHEQSLLNESKTKEEEDLYQWVVKSISEGISIMHDIGVMHGDLTTSNIMKRNQEMKVVLIDFGLSFYSEMAEDKAVDLYVLERAFLSTHPSFTKMFHDIIQHYKSINSKGIEVINRLDEVRMRGRKKIAFG